VSVAALPGSGSFCIAANLNARGHDVNDSTRDGDRLAGAVNIETIVRNPCDAVGDAAMAMSSVRRKCGRFPVDGGPFDVLDYPVPEKGGGPTER
jgi:hypothetical protein